MSKIIPDIEPNNGQGQRDLIRKLNKRNDKQQQAIEILRGAIDRISFMGTDQILPDDDHYKTVAFTAIQTAARAKEKAEEVLK